MANPFVHVELNTRDLDTSKKFYAGLFDWKLEEMTGGGDYSEVPGMGWFSVLADPTGAAFGLWQATMGK